MVIRDCEGYGPFSSPEGPLELYAWAISNTGMSSWIDTAGSAASMGISPGSGPHIEDAAAQCGYAMCCYLVGTYVH